MTQLTPGSYGQTLEGRHKLWQLIKDIEIAMLTTVAENGCLHSRPMATQQIDAERAELWFFSSIDSPKIAEIYHEREVGLAYASPATHRYVSVSGRAFVVRDGVKANELWTSAAKTWFPQGVNDPHLALLRIEVESAQFWDSPARVVHLGGLVELRLPRLAPENLGEGQKINVR
ncbi:MAG: pyridoxamine 5-phosphate oxidase [Rariglobus sp.]|jgi:general stress protein 26|nr:pyridoxamine 5-phosphate oxidase [Rariglobus sp.]